MLNGEIDEFYIFNKELPVKKIQVLMKKCSFETGMYVLELCSCPTHHKSDNLLVKDAIAMEINSFFCVGRRTTAAHPVCLRMFRYI